MAIVVRYDDAGLARCHWRDRARGRRVPGHQSAVEDAHPALRRGDRDVVVGLVGRLVVDGVPGVGTERLLHRPDLAEPGDRPPDVWDVRAVRRRLDGLRRAGIADHEDVAAVLGKDRAGVHDEVLARVAERHGAPVEPDLPDDERVAQVEPDLALVDRCAERDGRRAGQPPGLRGPVQRQPVVQRVDARVALRGVVGVLARVGKRAVVRRGGAGRPVRAAVRRLGRRVAAAGC